MILCIDASNIRAGGGITYLSQLLDNFKPEKHYFKKINVWAGKRTLRSLPQGKAFINLRHDCLLDRALPYRLLWQKMLLPKLASELGDILFLPGTGSSFGYRPYVTLSQNMLPFEYHEMIRYGFSWMLLRLLLLRMAQANAFRKADGIIFLSRHAYNSITSKINIIGQLKIVPHGIETRFFKHGRDQKPFSAYSLKKPFRFLYVSIVDVYKHQRRVVDAVAELRNEGFPVSLDLIGPSYPKAMKRLRKTIMGCDPERQFIRYLGPKPYRELHEYYQTADTFIFASSCENLPIILLEAMAGGLPIACSNRGPMPQVLGEAGLYFDPEKISDIREKLKEMVLNPNLRERCAYLAHKRAKKYSWERCASETFTFLAEVARSTA